VRPPVKYLLITPLASSIHPAKSQSKSAAQGPRRLNNSQKRFGREPKHRRSCFVSYLYLSSMDHADSSALDIAQGGHPSTRHPSGLCCILFLEEPEAEHCRVAACQCLPCPSYDMEAESLEPVRGYHRGHGRGVPSCSNKHQSSDRNISVSARCVKTSSQDIGLAAPRTHQLV
jgi:hypothetical protein